MWRKRRPLEARHVSQKQFCHCETDMSRLWMSQNIFCNFFVTLDFYLFGSQPSFLPRIFVCIALLTPQVKASFFVFCLASERRLLQASPRWSHKILWTRKVLFFPPSFWKLQETQKTAHPTEPFSQIFFSDLKPAFQNAMRVYDHRVMFSSKTVDILSQGTQPWRLGKKPVHPVLWGYRELTSTSSRITCSGLNPRCEHSPKRLHLKIPTWNAQMRFVDWQLKKEKCQWCFGRTLITQSRLRTHPHDKNTCFPFSKTADRDAHARKFWLRA